MRVLVCGGRDFDDYLLMNRVLSYLPRPTVIVHGTAPGADMLADKWAKGWGIKVESYPADWEKHGRAAGPLRNQQMIDQGKLDLVIAFPGGKGTADCVAQARKMGIPVREVS